MIWTNLNIHEDASTQLNFSGQDWEDFFLNSSKFRTTIFQYLPLKVNGALNSNKIKFSLSKDALCQDWLKLAKWFWRWRSKYETFTMTTTTRTDIGQRSLEPLTQVSKNDYSCSIALSSQMITVTASWQIIKGITFTNDYNCSIVTNNMIFS